MKKSLLKSIFIPTISLATCAAITIPLVLNTNVSNSQETNDDDSILTLDQLNAETTFVTFSTGSDPDVVIEGASTIKVKKGTVWAQVKQPKATKGGLKFEHWSLEPNGEDPVPLNTRVPDKEKGGLTVYPVFEDKLLLSNCIGLSVIESTTLSFAWHGAATYETINLQYSDNYGEHWTTVTPDSTFTLNPGDNVFLMGENRGDKTVVGDEHFSLNENDYASIVFSNTGAVNVAGNVMGLIDGATGTIEDIPNEYCFFHLFENNTALKYVSDDFLPSMNLTPHCYDGMFSGCSSLVMAPNLPAEDIQQTPPTSNAEYQDFCYKDLFKNCSSLRYIKLAYTGNFYESEADEPYYVNCFDGWVYGLDATEHAGEFVYGGTDTTRDQTEGNAIPYNWDIEKKTTSISISCVDPMYKIAADPSKYQFTANHQYQFQAAIEPESACKTIVWYSDNTSIATINPDNGILTGISPGKCKIKALATDGSGVVSNEFEVTIKAIDTDKCLIVNAASDEKTSVAYEYIGAGVVPQMKYSYNGIDWMKLWPGVPIEMDPNPGQGKTATPTVYIKGDNIGGLTIDGVADVSCTHFLFGTLEQDGVAWDGDVTLGGSVMGLMDDGRAELNQMGYLIKKVEEQEVVVKDDYCLSGLFSEADKITQIIEKKDSQQKTIPFLPCTNLSVGCYSSMFSNCINLTNAPTLPATDLTGCDSCYSNMFNYCEKITTAPALPASTLANYCYEAMFYSCHGLTSTPNLNAIDATEGCYRMMFQECNNLTSVKSVKLENLADVSCFQMFALYDGPGGLIPKISFTSLFYPYEGSIFKCPSTSGLEDPTVRMFCRRSGGQWGFFTATSDNYYGYSSV